jgi:hypothetical protein
MTITASGVPIFQLFSGIQYEMIRQDVRWFGFWRQNRVITAGKVRGATHALAQ